MFGKYLQPLERTDVILTAIEAMTDASISDAEGASSMLDEAMKDPNSWLTDVSGPWLDCPAQEPFQGLFFPPSRPPSLPAPFLSPSRPPSIPPSQAEALLSQQRGMGRAAVPVAAAGEMAALQWQHHPHLCPLQVPKIMSGIHGNLEHIRVAPARHSVDSLLLLLTNRCPREVVKSLLKCSPPVDRYRPRQP